MEHRLIIGNKYLRRKALTNDDYGLRDDYGSGQFKMTFRYNDISTSRGLRERFLER
jgi:hypothetical protein